MEGSETGGAWVGGDGAGEGRWRGARLEVDGDGAGEGRWRGARREAGRAIKKKYPIKKKINLYQKQNISHKELCLPLQTALAALRDVNLDVQISWHAQHFEHLQ